MIFGQLVNVRIFGEGDHTNCFIDDKSWYNAPLQIGDGDNNQRVRSSLAVIESWGRGVVTGECVYARKGGSKCIHFTEIYSRM